MTGIRRLAALEEVEDLEKGDRADVFALLRSCRVRSTAAGKPYGELVLADRASAIPARRWVDSEREKAHLCDVLALPPDSAVKVRFEVDVFRGQRQLRVLALRPVQEADTVQEADAAEGFAPSTLRDEEPEWLAERKCRTLVFDIETVPDTGIRDLRPTIVKALTEFAKRKDIDETAVRGLSPFFGKVVSLAFADGEDADAEITVLAVPRGQDDLSTLEGQAIPVDEVELLRAFWALAGAAETVVTYNGRGFDVPFLVGRSLMHGVPARVDLLSNRWSLKPHLDLLEILGQRGRGPSNLDVVCWALGIDSPKDAMDGSMVAPAYESGRIAEIAEYNRQDVRATAAVYRAVQDLVLRFRDDWS